MFYFYHSTTHPGFLRNQNFILIKIIYDIQIQEFKRTIKLTELNDALSDPSIHLFVCQHTYPISNIHSYPFT
jgi:hypothetical protein